MLACEPNIGMHNWGSTLDDPPTNTIPNPQQNNSGRRKEAGVVRNYPSAWPPNHGPRGRGANPELEQEEDLRLLLCGAVRVVYF